MKRKFNNDDSPVALPAFISACARPTALGNFRQSRFRVVFVFAYLVLTMSAVAQVSKEYQLKAVFLWRLAQFTQWPSDAFETSDSPIIICVLGDNPFDGALNAAIAGETAHGRKFVVQNHRTVEQLKTCHILYMAAAGPRQAKEITAALTRKSVLTVRESDIASSYPTIIQFLTEQNKIRLQINLKAAAAARLVLDPRLLRSAEIIETE
jgi:YfiR/HmsC-like